MAAQFPLLLPASKLPPKLVVFDLDKTLIAGDSTILWTEWLYEKGLVKDPIWRQIDREMIREYDQGRLDMHAFMRKHSGAFRNIPVEMLGKLALEFAKKRIAPLAYPDAKKWVKNALQAKIPMLVLSATTTFILTRCFYLKPAGARGRFSAGSSRSEPRLSSGRGEYRRALKQRSSLTESCSPKVKTGRPRAESSGFLSERRLITERRPCQG